MADMTVSIDPDELLGLIAVVELSGISKESGGEVDAAGKGGPEGPAEPDSEENTGRPTTPESAARAMMRLGLEAKLDELGLPWAPSSELVLNRARECSKSDDPARRGALSRFAGDARVRKYGISAATVATLVVLWGGYIQHWQWTGFPGNEQLWDWLHLLLLPVVFGTLPLWIQRSEYISRTRRALYVTVVVAFIALVIVGYLAPLAWTGFPGNTLWDWFELIMLPVAVIAIKAWPAAGRPVTAYHKAGAAALSVGWVVTLVGGYGANWIWTGYQGNTLWDWLSLLLLPLVFPTILLPALLKWTSGNAEERAEKAEKERKERERKEAAARLMTGAEA
jgi:hypothetical protein